MSIPYAKILGRHGIQAMCQKAELSLSLYKCWYPAQRHYPIKVDVVVCFAVFHDKFLLMFIALVVISERSTGKVCVIDGGCCGFLLIPPYLLAYLQLLLYNKIGKFK